MAASEFFNRWARRKADASVPHGADANPEPGVASETPAPAGADTALAAPSPLQEIAQPPRAPTLEDAALLTSEGNFVPFMADGVDDAVRRAALKKLFADPQFNIMDGLDIYVGDYSNMETMPESMLHQLNHARDLLDPLGTLERAAQSVERERQANLALERAGGDSEETESAAAAPAGPGVAPQADPVALSHADSLSNADSLSDADPLSDAALLTNEALLPVEALLSAAQAALNSQPAAESTVPAIASNGTPTSNDAATKYPRQ
jgi:hypothetical protein